MERREQYDPEDIESLLMERPFEELLPEERAFVLRHLKDADEYEAMRATLNALRNLHEDNEPVAADATVRENVMAAFREQRRPRFQIWLNSVGALFIPGESRGFWMPSLRLASLATVVGLSVWGLYRAGSGVQDAGFAELNEVEKKEAPPEAQPMPTEEANASLKGSSMADSAHVISNWSAQADGAVQAEPAEEGSLKNIALEDLTYADASTHLQSADEVSLDEAGEPVTHLGAVAMDTTAPLSPARTTSAAPDAAAAREEQLAEVAAVSKKKVEMEADSRRERKKDQEFRADAEAASSQALDAKLLTLQNAAW
ncbi:MAG: hypothetical protein IPJ76_17820 [Flavobacteriales bacterium]|nr:MAG: hypothetical protein IPJ76_17820 [Flavobacteriales bacterium]